MEFETRFEGRDFLVNYDFLPNGDTYIVSVDTNLEGSQWGLDPESLCKDLAQHINYAIDNNKLL